MQIEHQRESINSQNHTQVVADPHQAVIAILSFFVVLLPAILVPFLLLLFAVFGPATVAPVFVVSAFILLPFLPLFFISFFPFLLVFFENVHCRVLEPYVALEG